MPLQSYVIAPTPAVTVWGNLLAPVNPRELSSEREANLLGAMLNSEPSVPTVQVTGRTFEWRGETRRPWEVAARNNVGEMLAQMGGIDAAGNWSKDSDGSWQWNAIFAPPAPPPVVPRPPLVPGPDEVIVDMPGGLQVIRKKSEVESGTASATTQDQILAAVLNISERLKKINV
jgi:hypothetical protein